MTDFDERDLLGWTEAAGFETISLQYEVTITQAAGLAGIGWEALLGFSPNPLCPTIGEALQEALDRDEQRRFEAHLRPLVERNEGVNRGATAYLAATKGPTPATGS